MNTLRIWFGLALCIIIATLSITNAQTIQNQQAEQERLAQEQQQAQVQEEQLIEDENDDIVQPQQQYDGQPPSITSARPV